MKNAVRMGIVAVALLVSAVAYAGVDRVKNVVAGHKDCTTASSQLIAASPERFHIAFEVTSGPGTVYIAPGTAAVTAGLTNVVPLQQTGPVAAWNDDAGGNAVAASAFQCKAASGIVTVFFVEVKGNPLVP